MEDVAKHWEAFWAGESDSPMVWAACPKEGMENRIEVLTPHYPTRPYWNLEKIAGDVEELMTECLEFPGDTVPSFVPSFGPDQFAGLMGVKMNYSSASESTSWSEPMEGELENILPLHIKEDNPFIQAMDRYISALDMHSNLDAIAAMRGPENVCIDMIEKPEMLHRAMNDLGRIYEQVYNRYYAFGNMASTGTSAWLSAYSTKKYQGLASDFICLLSPAMANEFVLPVLERELAVVDHALFHLDGPDALAHLDSLLSLKKLHGIQWVPGAGEQGHGPAWFDLYKRILNAGKGLWITAESDVVKVIHKELQSPNIIYCIERAKPKAEIESLISWLRTN